MKRLFLAIWNLVSSRAVPPLVIGFFLVVYIGVAFFSDETLTMLMAITRRSLLLASVLAILPLNSACRIVVEVARYVQRRWLLKGRISVSQARLYDESVDLTAPSRLDGLEERLAAAGYRAARSGSLVAAWRGVSLAPARILFLGGTFCVFAGILVSLESRSVFRGSVIEGDIFQAPSGSSGIVERIDFRKSSGPILARDLTMVVAEPGSGGSTEKFGVYPPARYLGKFVYPRYLGIALKIRFSAPDIPGEAVKSTVMPIYPPGREASEVIGGTPYRVTVSLVKPDDGSDPYMTGRMIFLFKLLKGKDVLFSGSVPGGGEFSRDGYRLAFPDFRRMVITDFIGDYGVLLIWYAAILFLAAGAFWLPVRLFFPRREMLFRSDHDRVHACSRAEGGNRRHAGVFHEMLDQLDTKRPAGKSIVE